jgi:cyclic pyranopterin phosphate synthase
MPLGCAANFQMLPRKEIMAEIEKVFGALRSFSGSLGNGPAVYYSLPGFRGKIGFISPMSHNFCGTCNRLRLSAAGLLMPCLSGNAGLDVRAVLRGSGGTDNEAVTNAVKTLVLQKPRCHSFADTEQHDKEMFRIGG